jgi:hypothetical protein
MPVRHLEHPIAGDGTRRNVAICMRAGSVLCNVKSTPVQTDYQSALHGTSGSPGHAGSVKTKNRGKTLLPSPGWTNHPSSGPDRLRLLGSHDFPGATGLGRVQQPAFRQVDSVHVSNSDRAIAAVLEQQVCLAIPIQIERPHHTPLRIPGARRIETKR